MRLTKTAVEGARYQGRPLKRGMSQDIRWDDAQPGFGLRVHPTGAKTFVVSYRVNGRKRIASLGRLGEPTKDGALTVRRARKMAQAVIVAAREGQDRLERAPDCLTVADLGERYLEEHAIPKKRPRSVEEDRRLLRLYVAKSVGGHRVDSLSRSDVARLHHRLRTKPVTANRVLALLSKMLNLAEKWGLRPDGSNPCRHVDRYPEKHRERFLSGEELARLSEALSEAEADGSAPPSAIAAIRLLIFTGCRRQEILGLRWEQVDFERRLLLFEESKTGRKLVPLGAAALELLSDLRPEAGNPYVITGKKTGSHFVGLPRVWARIRERAGLQNLRIHDLRHSFASVGAGAGLSLPIIGKLLGHTQAATTQRYAHLAADPLHEAADRISGEIAAAMNSSKPAEVVKLDR